MKTDPYYRRQKCRPWL